MGRHAYLKLLSATTFIQCCYRQLHARKELQRLKQEAKELSIKPVGDSTMNHLDERGNDTIQIRSDSDFGVKFPIIQFYTIEHNSRSNRWIEQNFDMLISEVFVYVGVKFQRNQSSGRICDIGQNRLYEFCYLLSFDLWTSYLARILFLQGCDSLFWESSSSTKIFNWLQHSF
jgi:hypothetical protein